MGMLNYESPDGPKILRGVDRQWQQVADSMGATFRAGSLAQMAGRTLIIPAEAWTIVANEQGDSLRCRAVYVPLTGLKFRMDLHSVVLRGLIRFLLRPALGRRFIPVGDRKIDDHVFIQSNQAESVRRLLTDTSLRDLLLRQGAAILRVDPHPKIPNLSQITYRLPMGFDPSEFDPDRLRDAIEVVRGMLAGLMAIGAASGQCTNAAEW